MKKEQKRPLIILSLIVLILLIPLIAMQFTSEVNWTVTDFVIAALLLTTAGFGSELVIKKVSKPRTRTVISISILILLLLTWAELAVGIFGTPLAGS